MVERHNRVLGDSQRALLLGKTHGELGLLLPHIMRSLRGTPHTGAEQTPNFLTFGRNFDSQITCSTRHLCSWDKGLLYAEELNCRLDAAYQVLRDSQWTTRTEDDGEEPPIFQCDDLIWLQNKCRRKGENPKLQAKFVGPYEVKECFSNHTYHIERQGQESIQNESRVKLYKPCMENIG